MKLWHSCCKPRLETDVTQKVNRADLVFRQTDPDLVQTVKIPGLFRSLSSICLNRRRICFQARLIQSEHQSILEKRFSKFPYALPRTMADLHLLPGRAGKQQSFSQVSHVEGAPESHGIQSRRPLGRHDCHFSPTYALCQIQSSNCSSQHPHLPCTKAKINGILATQ